MKLQLKVIWKGRRKAALTSVEHNGQTIRGASSKPIVGSGEVGVSFNVEPEFNHSVRFGLVFAGQKLEELEAWVRVGGGEAKRIKAHKGERTHYWYAQGTYKP